MKKILLGAVFFMNLTGLFALEPWVSSYGSQTPYSADTHYTGFGMSVLNIPYAEALEAAKAQAAAALVNQIRVQVRTETRLHTTDTGSSAITSLEQVTRLSSDLDLPGISYLIERDNQAVYALAQVSRTSLLDDWQLQLDTVFSDIDRRAGEAYALEQSGNRTDAYFKYNGILPLTEAVRQIILLYSTVNGSVPDTVFTGHRIASRTALRSFEQELHAAVLRLSGSEILSLDQAFSLLVDQLVRQGVTAADIRVPALSWRSSDFSSAFGRYASERIRTEFLSRGVEAHSGILVVTGRYSDESSKDILEISLVAADTAGAVKGSAFVRFRRDLLPATLEIVPSNYRQALADQYALDQETFSDGTILVNAWTNRGADENSTVFYSGEELRIFLRVNQPAWIQMTYILVTGEKVLLEGGYYIGMDRVNRVVEYPGLFTPTAPFGVERLIITASSVEPSRPAVVPQIIDGQRYEVFRDITEVFAVTRGLRLISPADRKPAVGETSITITTMPAR